MSPRFLTARGLVVVATLMLGAPTTAFSDELPSAEEGNSSENGGVFVFAVPGVIWGDISPRTTPALDAFFADAAVASLATKVTGRNTGPGEAYATVGAGTRAVAPDATAADGMEPWEPYGVGTAAEEFERRTGEPLTGAAGLLGLPDLVKANDAALFGGEPGAVGQLLADSGWSAAVIANADDVFDPGGIISALSFDDSGNSDGILMLRHREALAALMDTGGQVAGGEVADTLVIPDADAAGGLHLDAEAVSAAFTEAWNEPAPVVLVEASDLRRADAAGKSADAAAQAALWDDALSAADGLFGTLLTEVDLSVDTVIVFAPTPRGGPHLTVLGMGGPDSSAGLLESAQTRRAGFVTITDIGPTILDAAGIDTPDSMEGRPAVMAGGAGDWAGRHADLVAADEQARFRDGLVSPFTLVLVIAQLVFLGLGVWLLRRQRGERGLRALGVAGLCLVGLLPATYLAGLFDFAGLGDGPYLGFVLVVGIGFGLAAWALKSRGTLAPLTALLTLDLAVIVVSVVVLGSALQQSTVFGDSPIVAGRFTGINNLTFAQLMVAAIVLAGVAAHRLPGRRGKVLAVAILAGALVIDVAPMWGADIGGILAGLPAVAVTGLLLLGIRPRIRQLVVWGGGALVLVVGLTALDLARPAASRSHLARLAERIGADGFEGFSLVVERKLGQNLRALESQPWTWLVVASILAAVAVWFWFRDDLNDLLVRIPEARAVGAGLLVAAVLGFALNDSGIAVPGMMAAMVNPLFLYLLVVNRVRSPPHPAHL